MVISVDTRGSDTFHQFISNAFTIISSQHPEHTFVFITGKNFHFPIIANAVSEKINERSSILSAISFTNKISSVLKKHNASVLVTCKPFSTKLPVCFIATEKTKAKYFRESRIIIAASEFEKNKIAEKYKIDNKKIEVVYRPANEIYKPVDFNVREKVKESYAGGNEFFISRIPAELTKDQSADLLIFLKAFSKFKKMQKSSMRLLMVYSDIIDQSFKELLRLYKFNTEVKLLENKSEAELATVLSSSYAAVFPFNSNDYAYLLQAMQSGAPVITSNATLMTEICGQAALYFDNTDVSIAEKMMLIYKDESLRQQLIENGRSQIMTFTSQVAADKLWSSLQKATL